MAKEKYFKLDLLLEIGDIGSVEDDADQDEDYLQIVVASPSEVKARNYLKKLFESFNLLGALRSHAALFSNDTSTDRVASTKLNLRNVLQNSKMSAVPDQIDDWYDCSIWCPMKEEYSEDDNPDARFLVWMASEDQSQIANYDYCKDIWTIAGKKVQPAYWQDLPNSPTA